MEHLILAAQESLLATLGRIDKETESTTAMELGDTAVKLTSVYATLMREKQQEADHQAHMQDLLNGGGQSRGQLN